MNNPESSAESEAATAKLMQGAANFEALEKLRAAGALGRWQACQSALANFHAPNVIKAATFWGGTMEVDIREAVSSQVFVHGVYEPELSAHFYRTLQPGQTFVDVGAHYGYFSILAAHRVGASGRVLSIEPCERTSWRLYHNVSALKQVKLHRNAAWDENTVLTLNDYGPVWSAFNSIGARRIHSSAPEVPSTEFKVDAVILDDLFAKQGVTPDVIQIDAESAELHVLRGLKSTLTGTRPVLTLEVGDYEHLAGTGAPLSVDILRAVSAFEYELFIPSLEGVTRHVIEDGSTYEYGNVVAVPREKREILGYP